MSQPLGIPVHGEVDSEDASPGVAFAFSKGGLAMTIGAADILFIETVIVSSEDELDYVVAVITDAAHKRVVKGYAGATGGISQKLSPPFECPAGVTPVLIMSAAGKVAATIQGYIQRA